MKKSLSLVLSCVILIMPALALAENSASNSLCARTTSSREFVQGALAVCLADSPSQRSACMRDAEQAFSACGYKGNFVSMSQRHQAKIVILSLFKNLVAAPRGSVGLASNTNHDQ